MRIDDRAKIIGVAPANQDEYIPTRIIYNDTTEVYGYNTATGSRQNVLTVSAGKTLYLKSISIQTFALAFSLGMLELNNASSVLQHYFYYGVLTTDQHENMSLTFNPCMEIAAGWKIDVYSLSANFYMSAQAYGHEK